MMAETNKFPDDFGELAGLTFEQAYEIKKQFVDFTLNEMQNPTGLWKAWHDFCSQKIK